MTASARTPRVSSTCHAPRAAGRQRRGDRAGVGGLRRVHRSRRTGSGDSRFSTGTGAARRARPARPGRPPAGRRRRGRGRPTAPAAGPRPALRCSGSSVSGSARAAGRRAEPAATCRRMARPPQTGSATSASSSRGGQRGRDDRGVGQHPAGGDVAPAGDLVAALPQRAHDGELAAAAHPVHARGPPPGVDLRRRRAGGDDRRELLLGPVALALLVELGGERVAQLDQDLDVERGVAQPRARAAGGCDQSAAEWPFSRSSPRSSSTIAPRPTRGVAEQPAGQLGVEQPARRAGRARPGRAGPGRRRAAPTRRRRWRRSRPTGRAARPGRSARCPSRRGAAARGRRAGRSGSRRRARRRRRPARSRRAGPGASASGGWSR